MKAAGEGEGGREGGEGSRGTRKEEMRGGGRREESECTFIFNFLIMGHVFSVV